MRPYPARPAYGPPASPAGGRNWPQVIVLQAIRIRQGCEGFTGSIV